MKQTNPGSPVGPVVTNAPDDRIFEKVCALLAPYNRTNREITRSTAIMADLEVDSVAVFDLIMEVEDAYDITFPMEIVSEMKSVGDLIATIQSLKGA